MYQNKYIVQCIVGKTIIDFKEYKIKDYAIKFVKNMNSKFINIKFRLVEVIYDEN